MDRHYMFRNGLGFEYSGGTYIKLIDVYQKLFHRWAIMCTGQYLGLVSVAIMCASHHSGLLPVAIMLTGQYVGLISVCYHVYRSVFRFGIFSYHV